MYNNRYISNVNNIFYNIGDIMKKNTPKKIIKAYYWKQDNKYVFQAEFDNGYGYLVKFNNKKELNDYERKIGIKAQEVPDL